MFKCDSHTSFKENPPKQSPCDWEVPGQGERPFVISQPKVTPLLPSLEVLRQPTTGRQALESPQTQDSCGIFSTEARMKIWGSPVPTSYPGHPDISVLPHFLSPLISCWPLALLEKRAGGGEEKKNNKSNNAHILKTPGQWFPGFLFLQLAIFLKYS